MAFYDKEKILEEANSLMVIEYLGVDYITKGSYVYIKCPGHLERLGKEDANFGNCVLTEKGYHCFACNVTVNMIDMVKEIEECDYAEALGIIGDALGGRNNYIISGEAVYSESREKTLSQYDFELLGLKSNVSIDEIAFVSNNKKMIIEEGYIPKIPDNCKDNDLYFATKHKSYSLRLLKNESPSLYYSIVKNKAKESMDKYQYMIDNVCNRNSEKSSILLPLSNGELSEEVLYDLRNAYRDMYNRCKEIYIEIDNELCDEKSTSDEEPNKIPNYNLFE